MIGTLCSVLLLSVASVEMTPVRPVFKFSLTRRVDRGPLIEIRNHTRQPVEFKHCGFYPNHRWSMKTASGRVVKLTEGGEMGAKAFGQGNDGCKRVKIAGGKSHRYATPRLEAAFELQPGDYTLEISYLDYSFEKPLKLVCPKIKVIVLP